MNMKNDFFSGFYRNKKVLITGNTGFKGSWLSIWLVKLGANVVGLSNEVPTYPSLFENAKLSNALDYRKGEIRDLKSMCSLLEETKPELIFHLAAQAIVSVSYDDPVETISTNTLGTATILEAVRKCSHPCTVVIITSDKCYENLEWPWGYRESDQIGGRDPYSASKGCAELIFHSFYESYFAKSENVRLCSARAGNVIGGGDWAKDRIVVDCVENWAKGLPVKIRCPDATRPWQHVLEPLSGYLHLARELSMNSSLSGQSYNFGPKELHNKSVINLLQDLSKYWNFKEPENAFLIKGNIPFNEGSLLKLNCDKALFDLKWTPTLTYEECVKYVSQWYYAFYHDEVDALDLCLGNIATFEQKACERGLSWSN